MILDNLISNAIKSYRSMTMSDVISDWMSGKSEELPSETSSGAHVSPATALTLSTIYACVKILADTSASLPLQVYKQIQPKGKELAREHYLYKLLHDKPNPFQTSFKWRHLMMTHKCLWGAGISEIEWDKNGYPIALWPIPPWRVKPLRTRMDVTCESSKRNYRNGDGS